jgi:hypothetical protein
MRLLSEKRDWDTRRALYAALLDATLLVPIDPEADGADEPLEVDSLGKFPVIAGFTDIDALRMWNPRGAPTAPPRRDLVPRALARRVGSLLINPRGNVGGELYLNELESLDGALKRRSSVAHGRLWPAKNSTTRSLAEKSRDNPPICSTSRY